METTSQSGENFRASHTVREEGYDFLQVTRELLGEFCDDFIAIDCGTIGERWEREHYAMELPGKWDSSWVAVDGGIPVGFVIASLKDTGVHVHRIAVAHSARGTGVGTRLLGRVRESAIRQGAKRVTLCVSARNGTALRFYQRLGFSIEDPASELLNLSISVQALGGACAAGPS